VGSVLSNAASTGVLDVSTTSASGTTATVASRDTADTASPAGSFAVGCVLSDAASTVVLELSATTTDTTLTSADDLPTGWVTAGSVEREEIVAVSTEFAFCLTEG
jgi:hypothetical protein